MNWQEMCPTIVIIPTLSIDNPTRRRSPLIADGADPIQKVNEADLDERWMMNFLPLLRSELLGVLDESESSRT